MNDYRERLEAACFDHWHMTPKGGAEQIDREIGYSAACEALEPFVRYSQEEFSTFAEAVAYGKSKCFDFAVHHAGEVLAGWSYFSGLRIFSKAVAQ